MAFVSPVLTAPADTTTADNGGLSNLAVLVALQANRIRGTIASVSRVALSVTEGSVPPEGEQHALVLAAVACLNSLAKPLADFAVPEGLKDMAKAAEDWIKSIKDGNTVTEPTDPDPDWVCRSSYGDYSGEDPTPVDMATD